MKTLEWTEELSVGVKLIDEQHKYFIGLINRLASEAENRDTSQVIEMVLQELWDYALLHFATEEKYFREFKYPRAEKHVDEHRKLAEILQGYLKKIRENNYDADLIFELVEFLSDWLKYHDQKEDMLYSEHFRKNGLC